MRLLLVLLLASPAWAFHSYPKGGAHDRATRRAAEATEMHSTAVSALKAKVRGLDVDELAVDLRATGNAGLMRGAAAEAFIQPRCHFEGSHHFQRAPNTEVDDVLAQGRALLKRTRVDALTALEAGKRDEALAALGLGLHVLQDFFAHSNAVFLDEHRQGLLVDWLLGEGSLPESHGVELIVYRPCDAEEPARIPGSSREASTWCAEGELPATAAVCMALSSPKSVAGAKKDPHGNRAYDRAVGFATDASIAWLQSVRREAKEGWETVQ